MLAPIAPFPAAAPALRLVPPVAIGAARLVSVAVAPVSAGAGAAGAALAAPTLPMLAGGILVGVAITAAAAWIWAWLSQASPGEPVDPLGKGPEFAPEAAPGQVLALTYEVHAVSLYNPLLGTARQASRTYRTNEDGWMAPRLSDNGPIDSEGWDYFVSIGAAPKLNGRRLKYEFQPWSGVNDRLLGPGFVRLTELSVVSGSHQINYKRDSKVVSVGIAFARAAEKSLDRGAALVAARAAEIFGGTPQRGMAGAAPLRRGRVVPSAPPMSAPSAPGKVADVEPKVPGLTRIEAFKPASSPRGLVLLAPANAVVPFNTATGEWRDEAESGKRRQDRKAPPLDLRPLTPRVPVRIVADPAVEPEVATRDSEERMVAGRTIGSPAVRPAPTLQAIAAELGRIEEKLHLSLDIGGGGGGGDVDLSAVMDLLMEIRDAVSEEAPAGEYLLHRPVGKDPSGGPLEPLRFAFPAQRGAVGATVVRCAALAQQADAAKSLRGLVGKSDRPGDRVTVTLRESLNG